MKKSLFLSILLVFFSVGATAKNSVDISINKSLEFISASQFAENNDIYWKGEWPVEMKSYLLPALLGVGQLWGRPTPESTDFATSSIMNLLAETYFLDPHYQQIIPLLNNGLASVKNYADGEKFNYYNSINYQGDVVHGPKAKGYVPNFIAGLTNVPSDADSTAAAYTAKAFMQQILAGEEKNTFNVPADVLQTFEKFRDVNRTPHYYNRFESIKNSGAYLTWFIDEHHMPKNIFAKPNTGARIPFGFNDVDCVVNANVMRLLTLTHNNKSEGYENSCALLNKVILNEKQKLCGIYYPNSYAVFFSISNAYKAGADCLEPSKNKALEFMMSSQNPDGSWANEPGIGRTDLVQSTALALNALMNYSSADAKPFKEQIRAGINFLLSKQKINSHGHAFWKGEVFFSAVAQARNTVLWRSDSYTTALVALTLVKAKPYLQGEL